MRAPGVSQQAGSRNRLRRRLAPSCSLPSWLCGRRDYPVEQMAHDAKACEIGEGTNEIQRIVIGRRLVKETVGS